MLDFLFLAVGLAVGGICFEGARWRGMASLGLGTGTTFFTMFIWLSIRTVGVPMTWGVISPVVLLVGGAAWRRTVT